jgi:hypothetical protein
VEPKPGTGSARASASASTSYPMVRTRPSPGNLLVLLSTALPPRTSAKLSLPPIHTNAHSTIPVCEGTLSPRSPAKPLSDSPLAPSANPPHHSYLRTTNPTRRHYRKHGHLGSGMVRRWSGEEGSAQESHPTTARPARDVEQAREAPTKPNGRARHHCAEIRLLQQER